MRARLISRRSLLKTHIARLHDFSSAADPTLLRCKHTTMDTDTHVPPLDTLVVTPAHVLRTSGDTHAAELVAQRLSPYYVAARFARQLERDASRGVRTSSVLVAQLSVSLPTVVPEGTDVGVGHHGGSGSGSGSHGILHPELNNNEGNHEGMDGVNTVSGVETPTQGNNTATSTDQGANTTSNSNSNSDSENARLLESKLEIRDTSRIQLALCYLEASQYDRTAWAVLPSLAPATALSAARASETPQQQVNLTGAKMVNISGVSGGGNGGNAASDNVLEFDTTVQTLLGTGITSSLGFPAGGIVPANLSSKALFIALLARFKLGERRRNESSLGKDFLADAFLANTEVKHIVATIEQVLRTQRLVYPKEKYFCNRYDLKDVPFKTYDHESQDRMDATTSLAHPKHGGVQDDAHTTVVREIDPYIVFLLGVCYNETGLTDNAIKCFIISTQLEPYFWGAWKELVKLLYTREKIMANLDYMPRANVMFDLFLLHSIAMNNTFGDYLDNLVDQLDLIFPENGVLMLQQALAYYRRSYPDASEHFFERYRALEPFSMEHLDSHSNVLFVRNDMVKLSPLAHEYFERNRFSPEACVAVGNYYSLRREHAQAIQYFRRAIRLRRNFPEAWVMIGHEHIEVKNPNAALEAYRRAADLAPWDYKAWFGMGSIFLTLGKPILALPYFKRALAANKEDSRIWTRISTTYDSLGNHELAAKALEKAEQLSETKGESIFS